MLQNKGLDTLASCLALARLMASLVPLIHDLPELMVSRLSLLSSDHLHLQAL